MRRVRDACTETAWGWLCETSGEDSNFLVACMGVVPSPGPRDAPAALLTAAGLECGLSISIPCPHLRPRRIIISLQYNPFVSSTVGEAFAHRFGALQTICLCSLQMASVRLPAATRANSCIQTDKHVRSGVDFWWARTHSLPLDSSRSC